jgi:hypothetical protein
MKDKDMTEDFISKGNSLPNSSFLTSKKEDLNQLP